MLEFKCFPNILEFITWAFVVLKQPAENPYQFSFYWLAANVAAAAVQFH
jgi:hypothetical protein